MTQVTAMQLAQSKAFQAMALSDAIALLSKNTGISVEDLIAQFPHNAALQTRCAEMVATAAKVTAQELNKTTK